jgi:hypothetical protein
MTVGVAGGAGGDHASRLPRGQAPKLVADLSREREFDPAERRHAAASKAKKRTKQLRLGGCDNVANRVAELSRLVGFVRVVYARFLCLDIRLLIPNNIRQLLRVAPPEALSCRVKRRLAA